jgi:hypothetical protein|tara:strand:+ start:2197 stop:2424 length:228 start_codon:yes stop_codon:yes gene_type:complete
MIDLSNLNIPTDLKGKKVSLHCPDCDSTNIEFVVTDIAWDADLQKFGGDPQVTSFDCRGCGTWGNTNEIIFKEIV